jgi:hypothetical protein
MAMQQARMIRANTVNSFDVVVCPQNGQLILYA